MSGVEEKYGSGAEATKYKSSNVFSKLINQKDVTLEEVITDDDFVSELRIQNDNLIEYLSYDRVKEMLDILLSEPGISDTSIKSFKLPFVICEVLTMDINHLTDKV